MTRFCLRDGTSVDIRPVRVDDAPRLQDLYKRLSPESAFFRFLSSWRELSIEKAVYLATSDAKTRIAYVATLPTTGEEQIIALASYVLLTPHNLDLAEAAVLVEDTYQYLGLGTRLLKHLTVDAQGNGVRAFVSSIHVGNERMLRWLENSGLRIERFELEDGVTDFQVRVLLPTNLGAASAQDIVGELENLHESNLLRHHNDPNNLREMVSRGNSPTISRSMGAPS